MLRPLLALTVVVLGVRAAGQDDLTVFPNVNFQTNFNVYSGYLNAGNNGTWKMHYALMESRSGLSTDPLLIWLNGGPGCSSFGGLFEELGPFYVNYDGQSLFENPYSWNARSNLLALESPIGVGFSYDSSTVNYTYANDNQTMDQNYNALKDFFNNIQPQYQNRTFYLSGESYAGIYIPMLSDKLIQGINSGDFPNKNFMGAAIGNGFMNVKDLMNSLVVWSAHHARISIDDWDKVKQYCKTGTETDYEYYNFQQFMYSSNGMDYYADSSTCGKLIDPLITDTPAGPIEFDQYNYYQDCYDFSTSVSGFKKRRDFGGYTAISNNTAQMFNYDSTDAQLGYTCWNDIALLKYLHRTDVQNALHIPSNFLQQMPQNWRDCNDPLYDLYNLTYADMEPFFKSILANVKTPGFRILVYNGDVDTVCNYLGDSWFIRRVANHTGLTPTGRIPWLFGQQVAGYVQKYSGNTANGNPITIDVLTVKGAGHFVPGDRQGPALQMITNFMFPTKADQNGIVVDYSSTAVVQPQPKLSPLVSSSNSTTSTTTPSTTLASAYQLLLTFIVSMIICIFS